MNDTHIEENLARVTNLSKLAEGIFEFVVIVAT